MAELIPVKISYPLSGSYLGDRIFNPQLFTNQPVCFLLHALLKLQRSRRAILVKCFPVGLINRHHYPGIRKERITARGRHTVDHQFILGSRCRYNKAARTHTEAEYAPLDSAKTGLRHQ
ncbi:hypothetical protein FQZ97_1134710 [compost metagenome]